MGKKCPCCKLIKPYFEYYKRKRSRDGFYEYCKLCVKKKHKKYYETNKILVKSITQKYRDKERIYYIIFIRRMYWFMSNRIMEKRKYYRGKELCDRNEFIRYAFTNWKLKYLYCDWAKNGYQRKYRPVIDRIDSNKGYIISNMNPMTFSENSSKYYRLVCASNLLKLS
jgi:hypothetical protein